MKPHPTPTTECPVLDTASSPRNDAFAIFEKVSTSERSIVYRGRSLRDGEPVIVKGLKGERYREEDLRAYARESEIAEHLLGVKGVAQLMAWRSPYHKPLIVYHDHGAIALSSFMAKGSLSIMQKTAISVKIADALTQLHARGIVHRDINPSNIVYDEKNATIELIDFGIARFDLPGHDSPARSARQGHIEGTLPYIAPEQTGRLLCVIDRRSDLYGLGATLYEIFTGRPPFDEKEPLKLIHAHIALSPIPPAERQRGLPLALSRIIMKLLEKRPQDRYQSARGVKADLQKCLYQLSGTGTIDPFILGSKDIPDDLNMPERLYGRNDEIQLLTKCLQKAGEAGAQLVIVDGEAGSGKSALVHELFRPMIKRPGRFIEGRAEPQNDAQPYAPVIAAIRGLLAQILCASDAEVAKLSKYCDLKLTEHVVLCARYFPEICDAWPAARQTRELPAAQVVPLITIAKIIHELLAYSAGGEDGPLVMFLDDMQYSDTPTQKLLAELSQDEKMSHLLCLLALRQGPMEREHPLGQLIARERLDKNRSFSVHLLPLGLHETVEMISDIFHLNKDDVFELAQIVVQKCGGNPSRMREMLVHCTSRGMIAFNPASSRWGWDIGQIRTLPLMDNVIDLMRQKLMLLTPECLQILLAASVWGPRFEDSALAVQMQTELALVKKGLREALMAGIIQEYGEELGDFAPGSSLAPFGRTYLFCHEKICEKLYQSLDNETRRINHASIAESLLAAKPMLQPGPQMERLAHHLNRGGDQAIDPIKLARINHAAYIFAHLKGSASAAEYLNAASTLLANRELVLNEKWQSMVVLDLMWEAFRAGRPEVAGEYAERLLVGAPQPLAHFAARAMLVALAVRQGRTREADKMAMHWLTSLKARLQTARPRELRKAVQPTPSEPTLRPLQIEETRQLLRFVLDAGQGALSRRTLGKITAFGCLVTSDNAQQSDHLVFELHQAILLTERPKTMNQGRRLAQTATAGLSHLWNMGIEGEALLHYADHLHHLTGETPQKMLENLRGLLTSAQGADVRLRALLTYVAHSLYHGLALEKVEKELGQFQGNTAQTGESAMLTTLRAMVARLSGQATLVPLPDLPAMPIQGVQLSYDHWLLALIGMITSYLTHDYQHANLYNRMVQKGRAFARGSIHGIFAAYYGGLLISDSATRLGPLWGRLTLLTRLEGNLRQLRRCSKRMPTDYRHRYELLRTMVLAACGCAMAAQRGFEQAIEESEKACSTHDLALAYELAGRFYAVRQRGSLAQAYLKKAWRLHLVIGSLGKVRRLAEEFPALEHGQESDLAAASFSPIGIDLHAMREALTAIVSEAVAMRMLQKVLDASLRFLGAGRGVLILRKEKSRYEVEIEGNADGTMTPYYRAIALGDYKELPQSVIDYVKRTKKTVIMHKNLAYDENDAFPADLLGDPYLAASGVKSLLCYPIVLQGSHHVAHAHLVAILYLENRLVDGCFSIDRVETLKIICLAAAGRLELSIRASTDGLTGLYNYDHFQSMLQREFLQAQRGSTPLSMLMIDIDNFKNFNDRWGHLVGDRVLKEVAHVIQTQCRKSDIVARYGGEEMAVILPGTTTGGALLLAERIRSCIESLGVGFDDNLVQVTASIGVASLAAEMGDKEGLVGAADKALYVSKNRGRNCVSQG